MYLFFCNNCCIFKFIINGIYIVRTDMTALESEILLQELKVTAAFNDLRKKKLNKGLPFLILSEDLPDGQSYLEYADGRIELQEVYEDGALLKSKSIRVLSETEAVRIRLKNGLF